jgi:hypothetical protein
MVRKELSIFVVFKGIRSVGGSRVYSVIDVSTVARLL